MTSPEVPLQRDVLRETFDAFRGEGLETGFTSPRPTGLTLTTGIPATL
ncbi:hypothetical protein NHF46_13440 [Arthrobacter alpinus]|nr:hypothetical protein [Arthrobacter alpinus]